MSYIPPHKRQSSGSTQQSLKPEMLPPSFEKNLNLGQRRSYNPSLKRTMYAANAVGRWFAVGLEDDDGKLPPSVCLLPVTVKGIDRQGKNLALVNSRLLSDGDRVSQDDLKKPWVFIAERVLQELLPSFEYMRSDIKNGTLEDTRPSLVARIGKVLFERIDEPMDESSKDLVTEECLRQMKRMFYTSVPSPYSENIVNNVVPTISFKFEGVKDVYHLMLSDNSRPNTFITCKCRVMKEDNNLELYKIELNRLRQMVCDFSCLNSNLDLRVMLYKSRYLTSVTNEEEETINKLVKYAIIDPNVMGGLKWPSGMDSGDRYTVARVWHKSSKIYSSPFMKLEVKVADRFDLRSLVGEVSQEINLKLKGIASKLMEKKIGDAAVLDMLSDAIKLLWEKFLSSS